MRWPQRKRELARRLGLALAMLARLALPFSIAWRKRMSGVPKAEGHG